MGTRNLTAVYSDGKYKLAQYGQWDGNPAGQGLTALEFCQNHLYNISGREKFKEQLNLVKFVNEEEYKKLLESVNIDSSQLYLSSQEVNTFEKKFPHFSRDWGAEILEEVLKAESEVLTSDAIAFVSDSLFCEWAYVIDLDLETFEVYEGFNQKPLDLKERFSSFPQDNDYFPVKLLKRYYLNNLPTEEVFIQECDPKDEE